MCCRRLTASGDAGYREIAITGVHLGSYGRDLADGSTLLDLLETIERHAPEMRFRISSLEPMDCSDEIVDLVAASSCFAPHFHLPLQHASDAMLVAMRRPYTLAITAGWSIAFASDIPHASIGTDIIVGFPGETDEDFAVLEAYLRDVAHDTPARVSLFRSAGHCGHGIARQSARLDRARARRSSCARSGAS